MRIILVFLLFVNTVAFSQEERTINLGDFNTLKSYRGLHVELVRSDHPKIVITGSKSKEVNVKNSNGVLKISLTVLETFSADEVNIIVYYNDNLDHLSANEGSVIFSNDKIEIEKLYLKATEAAEINLNIKSDYIEVKAYTGGIVKLEGLVKNQNISANTGGFYKGSDLESDDATVRVYTGGDATVNVSNLVDANASMGGIIRIKGDPKKVNKKESLGGYVRD
ncbi:MAG: DUF2807 domain-containing protein [Flavobacteriaceae bacterium]|nr:DUF2807 domain-containing protein [Flavobacteriaceae bacterium]